MSTKQSKEEFYGPCLPQRKRHYFGRDTGWAGGMGQPAIHYCIWCGKYNPKWEPKFWEEEMERLSQKELLESLDKMIGHDRASRSMYYGSRHEQAHKQLRELVLCEDMVQQYRDEKEAEQAEIELTYIEIVLDLDERISDLCKQLEAKEEIDAVAIVRDLRRR